MRILITNDDGIHAEGLDICEKIARSLSDDVWVVAPEYDQSGVAHSLSLNNPLRLRQVAERRFAVRGTPTDCIIMGARHLLSGKGPDLVLSGVNRGSNVGEDVIYSGTVAGAVEGTMLGIPSLALSQAFRSVSGGEPHWETSLHFAPDITRRIVAEGALRDVLINVNFPDCPPEEVKRIVVTAQGRRGATFRTWGEDAGFPSDLLEESPGHQIGNSVERPYRRTNSFNRRRAIMEAWADFCCGKPRGKTPNGI